MLLSRLALAVLLAAPLAAPIKAVADTAETPATDEASVSGLVKTLQIDALFDVLRQEGLAQGDALQETMLAGDAGLGWDAAMSAIYDVPALRARFDAALTEALAKDPATASESLAFFASDLGQRILGLEIDARRAFLDIAQFEEAQVVADTAKAGRDPNLPLIARMIEAGDLIEMNVAAGLTGSLSFMTGLNETGALGPTLPPEALMSDVWAQEEQIRADTKTHLTAYFGLAYSSLTEAELSSYVAFWESPAGQRLNAALFTAYAAVFDQVQHDLGRAAGRVMSGSDI